MGDIWMRCAHFTYTWGRSAINWRLSTSKEVENLLGPSKGAPDSFSFKFAVDVAVCAFLVHVWGLRLTVIFSSLRLQIRLRYDSCQFPCLEQELSTVLV